METGEHAHEPTHARTEMCGHWKKTQRDIRAWTHVPIPSWQVPQAMLPGYWTTSTQADPRECMYEQTSKPKELDAGPDSMQTLDVLWYAIPFTDV